MIIVWHHCDLRLEDHPALFYAAKKGTPVVPIYIYDTSQEWALGRASQWWLHHSLHHLKKRYESIGNDLSVFQGQAKEIIQRIAQEGNVQEFCWIEKTEPSLKKRDEEIAALLKQSGIKVSIFQGNYLINPEEIKGGSGNPYQVFTPFYRSVCAELHSTRPLKPPTQSKKGALSFRDAINDLKLLPQVNWDETIKKVWEPGRDGALKALTKFCSHAIAKYDFNRDFLPIDGTSMLSPYLAFGEISIRDVWETCNQLPDSKPFCRQLIWREFARYFLYHFPKSPNLSWKLEFERYPWSSDKEKLVAWQRGETGYPIIDAAMKQLWKTGWMHNRARMIVGSFLVKDLHIHWIEGARWFWDTLVDADLANNTLGWQWIAGSGPDAAPFFRIFNPILQGQKFDPEGRYVKKYVPQLEKLPQKWIHSPWEAPTRVLSDSGIVLGRHYPKPIVNHKEAREKALLGYKAIKSSKKRL